MKIPASVRGAYDEQRDASDALKKYVDDVMRSNVSNRWHYESRVKELQSYALKLETGRVGVPVALEDFFACTIVVPNFTEVETAVALAKSFFTEKYRKPKDPIETHKRSSSFDFDDLRIYMEIPFDGVPLDARMAGRIFELQVKTYLQHAWGLATHDLIYKSDEKSWPKERVAFQVKAMLEHAELAIAEASVLAGSGVIALEDKGSKELKSAIEVVRAHWTESELPRDVVRLATNMLDLLRSLGLPADVLENILSNGRVAGSHPANLSPYGALVQYLVNQQGQKVVDFAKKDARSRRNKVLVLPSEIELPAGLALSEQPGIVSLGGRRA